MITNTMFSIKPKPEFGLNQFQIVANTNIDADTEIPDLIGFFKHMNKKQFNAFVDHYSIISWDSIPYLLLGPVSFVNHSCAPNAIFIKDYKNGMIKIQSVKDIKVGMEITVSYGSKYFGPGECLCDRCQSMKTPSK